MQKESIYLFGQNLNALDALKLRLMTEGYDVDAFSAYPSLAKSCEQNTPDLIILTESGEENLVLELCMRLRDLTSAIMFVISSRSGDIDKISALSAGADEYITYPFSLGVLIAQIHAAFRRSKLRISPDSKGEQYLVDLPDLKIDAVRRQVTVQYKPVSLTAIEFEILNLLAGNPNQVFYTSQIFQNVWDTDSILMGDDKTVTVHISNLRKKVEVDPLRPKYIITVRGIGYKFAMPDARHY